MKPNGSFLTCLLVAVLLTSCARMQNPTPTPREEKPFRIVAYATDAIIVDLIPYDKLTHINYSFLIPNADGTFASLNNSWKLKMIAESAHSQGVSVSIAVGGWGWDAQFEQMAADAGARA